MESIDVLNGRLVDYFGIDSDTARPIFRIVWSDDQTEHRLTKYLDSGIELLYPVIREVKKYPYIQSAYVLERLVIVPEINQEELAGLKTSYEPLWVYEKGKYPNWPSLKFVIDTMYAALGKKSLAKYTEDASPEAQEKRIDGIQQELFGDENDTTDALAYREGVVVPSNYTKH